MHKIAFYVTNKAATTQIIDARSPQRFHGEVDEPRPGLRKGHISGSTNVFFEDLINKETGTLKSDKEIGDIFTKKGIDITSTTVCSCGSGVTACIPQLGLNILGNDKTAIYDGSWLEYVILYQINIIIGISGRTRLH